MISKGLTQKNKVGSDYEGWCWPGPATTQTSKKEARDYFADQYKLENYQGEALDVFTWNDMNEPSVFNGPRGHHA